MTYRARVLTQWTESGGVYRPALTLPTGCAATDVTAQPVAEVSQPPNTVTWEVYCPDAAALAAVVAAVDHVLWTEDLGDGETPGETTDLDLSTPPDKPERAALRVALESHGVPAAHAYLPVDDVTRIRADVSVEVVGYQQAHGWQPWTIGETVAIGDIRDYDGTAYRCIQAHTTQGDWAPSIVPALWVISREDVAGADWIVSEPVAVGTVRTYDGQEYECIQAHTTQAGWEPPNVPALWQPVEEEPEQPAEWVQPTGAHDAYQIGDLVTFNGQVYRSKINANVWSPAVYPAGWELIPWP